MDRHKFCPKDSPYNEVINAVYGMDEHKRLRGLYGEAAAWPTDSSLDL